MLSSLERGLVRGRHCIGTHGPLRRHTLSVWHDVLSDSVWWIARGKAKPTDRKRDQTQRGKEGESRRRPIAYIGRE